MSPIEQALRELANSLRGGDWNVRAPQEMADMIADSIDNIRALEAPQQVDPNYSELSREALERHAVRMAQVMATTHAFWTKHALGPLSAPSCLCCSKLPDEVAITHMELPGVVICKACRDKALGVSEAAPAGWNFKTFDDWWVLHGRHNYLQPDCTGKSLAKLAWEVARELAAAPSAPTPSPESTQPKEAMP